MVIATMVQQLILNEHEMNREKSSQIWQFSCHKELEVGINRHHPPNPIAQNRHFFRFQNQ